MGATEVDERTGRPRFKRGRSVWEARVRHEAQRLRADLASCTQEVAPTGPRAAVDSDRIRRICEHLEHADDVLDHHFQRNWMMRLITAGHAYQEALASVYRASEDLILVQSADAVAARLPSLRAAVKSYLSADDPRRESYLLRIDAALITIGAERMAEMGKAADGPAQRSEERVDGGSRDTEGG